MYSFKQKFSRALNKVCKAWPEIKVICGKNGLTLYPCKSSLDSEEPVQKTPQPVKPRQVELNPFA